MKTSRHTEDYKRYKTALERADSQMLKNNILHRMEQEADVTDDEAQELYEIARTKE